MRGVAHFPYDLRLLVRRVLPWPHDVHSLRTSPYPLAGCGKWAFGRSVHFPPNVTSENKDNSCSSEIAHLDCDPKYESSSPFSRKSDLCSRISARTPRSAHQHAVFARFVHTRGTRNSALIGAKPTVPLQFGVHPCSRGCLERTRIHSSGPAFDPVSTRSR